VRVGAESGEHAPAAVGNSAGGRAAAVGAEGLRGREWGKGNFTREPREANWREARGEGFSFLL